MRVTYLNHSGFLLEWEKCCWLFDYYRGEIPELKKEKPLFVFCSHSHSDHYNPAVFELSERYRDVTYVFSNQVRALYRRTKIQTGKKLPEVLFVYGDTDVELPDRRGGLIRMHILPSTDCGCAFFLEYGGRTVYHAGDLHWWIWPGEPEEDNRRMTGSYRKYMSYLENRKIDLAFTPLDPRQEEYYDKGINYLLEKAQVGNVFPMHFWDDFSVTERYLNENRVPEHTVFYRITEDGQYFELSE